MIPLTKWLPTGSSRQLAEREQALREWDHFVGFIIHM
jgi:hypothetical protein